MSADGEPARWYGSNLVGVPAPVLGSTAFNAKPVALHIAGVRQAHAGLFALLARCADAAECRAVFAQHMSLSFSLAPAEAGIGTIGRTRRWRASYLKLLQGWGLDASSAAGAVLKGWVESRFGLMPVYHRTALLRFPSPAWMAYLEDKAGSRFNNNNVLQQLDLLYEFSQWMLLRFQPLGSAPCVTLWRGSTRCEEQLVQGSLRARRCTVR